MSRMPLGLAVVAATTALLLVSASADAAHRRGRGASEHGLGRALEATSTHTGGGVVTPTENISLNFEKAQDPTQPGVTPGGGDPEP